VLINYYKVSLYILATWDIRWYKLAVPCDCDNDVEVSDTVESSGTPRFDHSPPPSAGEGEPVEAKRKRSIRSYREVCEDYRPDNKSDINSSSLERMSSYADEHPRSLVEAPKRGMGY
jgi:hypothetical protein